LPSDPVPRRFTVLGPNLSDQADDGTLQQIAGYLRLWTIFGQHAIEQDNVGRKLCKFVSLRVVRTLCRSDQQSEDQGRHRCGQTHTQLDDVLRIRAQMMLGQNQAKGHPQERTSKDTSQHDPANTRRVH
jgi:hypothetical protein